MLFKETFFFILCFSKIITKILLFLFCFLFSKFCIKIVEKNCFHHFSYKTLKLVNKMKMTWHLRNYLWKQNNPQIGKIDPKVLTCYFYILLFNFKYYEQIAKDSYYINQVNFHKMIFKITLKIFNTPLNHTYKKIIRLTRVNFRYNHM